MSGVSFALPLVLVASLLMRGCEERDPRAIDAAAIGDPEAGRAPIEIAGCGSCHMIPGIQNARGLVGPPLIHWSRRTIIAGLLQNTPTNTVAWLRAPQSSCPTTPCRISASAKIRRATSPPTFTRLTDRAAPLAPKRRVALRRHLPLALSAVLLVGLWAGPLPALARVSFTAHMALHLGVVVVAAPLLALGLARAGLRARFGLGAAIGFSAIEMLIVWGWHAPLLHAAAALRPPVFVLQQASFLLAGIIVWLPGLADAGGRGGAAGVLAMFASFTHMTMLGVLLAVAPGFIYDPALCGGAFGLNPLSDQQMGGALMAVLAGPVYLAGALVFLARLLGAEPSR